MSTSAGRTKLENWLKFQTPSAYRKISAFFENICRRTSERFAFEDISSVIKYYLDEHIGIA